MNKKIQKPVSHNSCDSSHLCGQKQILKTSNLKQLHEMQQLVYITTDLA